MSEERYYTIPHNYYDDNGKLIETKDVKFKTNVTDTTVYLTLEVLINCHSEYPHGAHYASANFANREKRYVFENEKFGYVGDNVQEVVSYKMECNGTTAYIEFTRPDGTKFGISQPVWDHPFIKKDKAD